MSDRTPTADLIARLTHERDEAAASEAILKAALMRRRTRERIAVCVFILGTLTIYGGALLFLIHWLLAIVRGL